MMGDVPGCGSHEYCSMDLGLIGSYQSFLFNLYLKITEKTVRDRKSRRKYILPSRVTEEKDLLPIPLHLSSQNSVQEDAAVLCRACK